MGGGRERLSAFSDRLSQGGGFSGAAWRRGARSRPGFRERPRMSLASGGGKGTAGAMACGSDGAARRAVPTRAACRSTARAEHGYALRFTEPVNSRVRSCGCGARPVQDACRPSGRRADGGAGASSEVASLRCAGRRGMSGVGSNHHDGREPLMAAHTVSLPIHPPWGLLPKSLTCRRHRLRRML